MVQTSWKRKHNRQKNRNLNGGLGSGKPDNAKPDNAKPDNAKPDNAKSDDTNSYDSKPNYVKSDNRDSGQSRKIPKYQVMLVLVMILAAVGICLPGWLLMEQSENQMDMVDAVPVEYYSPANLAVARNASANLGVYQKLQLITGRWESHTGQTDSDERTLENYEAVDLAKEQLDALYRKGLYPVSLISDYGNWYSWEAEFCKVVDATFNTYAAYYWEIRFEKYDGTEQHRIYMLEDGTIFLAEAGAAAGLDISAIAKILDVPMDSGIWDESYMENGSHSVEDSFANDKTIMKQKVKENSLRLEEYFAFADVESRDLDWMDQVQLRVGEQEYHVLQLYSANRYLFSVQPAD